MLDGWALRFWQGSEDHRGTPESPGRVATLIAQAGGRVTGAVYRLEGDREAILAYLDHREKGGYDRVFLRVQTEQGELEALTYVGPPTCTQYVGPEEESVTAAVIAAAVGPSGRNVDYLMSLQSALAELGASDTHVDRLVHLLLLNR